MKNIIQVATAMLIALSSCGDPRNSQPEVQKNDSTETKKSKHMNSLISIVEIPVTDFSRAVNFYQIILDVRIEEMDMSGTQMGILPGDGETVNVVLVKGNDYHPGTQGAVLYLNAGADLQPMLDKVEQNGGQVLVPKTEISPEIGYFALFVDTEGNRLGLHSAR